jgi:hypothetical protein
MINIHGKEIWFALSAATCTHSHGTPRYFRFTGLAFDPGDHG